MLNRLKCFFLKHDEVDVCTGDSCWYCARCGKTHHDARLPYHGGKHYAQGGYIPGGMTTIQLSPGHALMSYASYKALGPEGAAELFPNTTLELLFTADDVRKFGAAALEKIRREMAGE